MLQAAISDSCVFLILTMVWARRAMITSPAAPTSRGLITRRRPFRNVKSVLLIRRDRPLPDGEPLLLHGCPR